MWSPEPTHEALVSLDVWQAAQKMTRQGSRSSGPNTNPNTRQSYVLRSYIVCACCGRRMEGDTRRKKSGRTYLYYVCRPARNLGPGWRENVPGHAPEYRVREDHLLAGILDLLAERVFGAHRRDHLADDLGAADTAAQAEWQQRITNLETALADVATRRERLAIRLEEEDDRDLIDDIRARHATLAARHKTLRAELAEIRDVRPAQTADDPTLLDLFGTVSRDELASLPADTLRAMFDAFALTVAYKPDAGRADLTVTLTDHQSPDADQALAYVLPFPGHTPGPGGATPVNPGAGDRPNGFGMFVARSA